MATEIPKKATRTIRVLIADDHVIVRRGLIDLIGETPDMEVVAALSDPDNALAEIERLTPDVALLDLQFEGVKGFDLLKDVRARCPQVKTLVLSMHDEANYAERCIRAGALGYLMKSESAECILGAIRRVSTGQIHLSDAMSGKLLNVFIERGVNPTESKGSIVDSLTDRELQVFELLGHGMTTRAVAERLHLSVKTIETHRLSIMSKLQIPNPNELIRQAVYWLEHDGNSH